MSTNIPWPYRNTPFECMKIILPVIAVNDGRWGADTTDQQVEIIASNYQILAQAWAGKTYPGAEIEVTLTRNPGARGWASDDSTEDHWEEDDPTGPVAAITDYMSRQWFEEALWSPEFDVDAYLEAHPQ